MQGWGAPAGMLRPGPPPTHIMTEPKGVPQGRVLPPGPQERNASSVQPYNQTGILLLRVLDITGTLLFPPI